MLRALIHGKCATVKGGLAESEDVLTSDVFGTFRYLNCLDVPEQFLRQARNVRGEPLRFSALRKLTVFFWPSVTFAALKRREPDVVVILDCEAGERVFVVIEAKFRSGPSDREVGDGTSQTNAESVVQLGNQLADEFQAMQSGTWPNDVQAARSTVPSVALVYITAHFAFPNPEFERAKNELEQAHDSARDPSADGLRFADRFFWLSWRQLHRVLSAKQDEGFTGYSAGEQELLKDLREGLEIRNLVEFRGFNRKIIPCDPYWRVNLKSPVGNETKLIWHRCYTAIAVYRRIWRE